jgi:hypothetical protein
VSLADAQKSRKSRKAGKNNRKGFEAGGPAALVINLLLLLFELYLLQCETNKARQTIFIA